MKKIKLLAVILVAVMCLTMALVAIGASGEVLSTNVALDKPVQAGNGYKPTNVTDGSTDGYFDAGHWTSSNGGEPYGTAGNCYVEIDLGEEYSIDKIKVVTLVSSSRIYNWEAYATTDNTADISTWTFIGEKDDDVTSSKEGTTVEFDKVTARYVRVYGTFHNENIGYHFNEIEVYADVEREYNKTVINIKGQFGDMENWSSGSAYNGLATQILVGLVDSELYDDNNQPYTLTAAELCKKIKDGTYQTQLVIDKSVALDIAPSTYYADYMLRFEPAKVGGFYPVKGQTYEVVLNVFENGELKYTGKNNFKCPMNPIRVYDGFEAEVYDESGWYNAGEMKNGNLVILPNYLSPLLFPTVGDNDRTDLSVRWEMYVDGVKYDIDMKNNYTWNWKTQVMGGVEIINEGFTPVAGKEYSITFKAYQKSWPSKTETLVSVYNMKTFTLNENMLVNVPYTYDIVAENGGADVAFADGTYILSATGANEGFVFTGWYVDGELVTKESVYTFDAVDGANSVIECGYADISTLPTFPITFVVNGVETVIDTVEGFVPVFTGSTDKAASFTTVYTFAGWDKEIVAATEATTYTATYTESVHPVRVLTGGRYGTGMENWGDTVQLLFNVSGDDFSFDGMFNSRYDYTWQLTWTWTDAEGEHTQVQKVAPSSGYAWDAKSGFYRFEITRAVDTFVPVKGQVYYIDLDIYYGDYHAYTVEGNTTEYVINVDPITHNFYTITWKYNGEVEYTERILEGNTPVYAGAHKEYLDGYNKYVPYVAGGTVAATGDATYEIEYTVIDTRLIEVWPYFSGWENWPEADPQTQLLIIAPFEGNDVTINYTWTFTIGGKTITIKPSSYYNYGNGNAIWRFEVCLAEGANQFIPVAGESYTITDISVYDGETLVKYGDCTEGETWDVPADFVPVLPAPEFGFITTEDGTMYMYEDGTFAKNFTTIEGKTYYFGKDGILFEGESIAVGVYTYWFDAEHAVREGLLAEDGGYRYYKAGVRQYGWVDIDADGTRDMYFYVSSQLRCEEDRVLFDGKDTRRFFKYNAETGCMEVVNGFYTNEKGTQFFKNGLGQYGWITAEGVSITDKPGITLSNVHYFAYGDGINFYMVEDATKTIGGVVREFDENHLAKAYTGWSINKKTGSSQYYIDGVMQQGWVETADGWIYLSRSQNLDNNIDYGDAFYGWKKIGGKVYYFRAGTSTPAFTLITDESRALTYDGVRDVYYINQPADAEAATGADYFITNPPAGF